MGPDRIICIPAPSTAVPALYARTAALGATSIVTLQVGQPFQKVMLLRWKIKRVAGAAANFTPYIFSEEGVMTAGHISQEAVGAATAVGTLFDPQIADAPVVMQTDINGRLYMMVGPDAGADNTFDYALRFKGVV